MAAGLLVELDPRYAKQRADGLRLVGLWSADAMFVLRVRTLRDMDSLRHFLLA